MSTGILFVGDAPMTGPEVVHNLWMVLRAIRLAPNAVLWHASAAAESQRVTSGLPILRHFNVSYPAPTRKDGEPSKQASFIVVSALK